MELSLKPSHAKVKDYYNALNQFGQLNISHEMAVRSAFASLVETCARKMGMDARSRVPHRIAH